MAVARSGRGLKTLNDPACFAVGGGDAAIHQKGLVAYSLDGGRELRLSISSLRQKVRGRV